MNGLPPNSGACCLPNADGLTYVRIGSQGHTVGMRGLVTIFQQLFAMGRRSEDTTDVELIGMAREFNYIPYKEHVEADYAVALQSAYAAFYAQQEKKV
jgi:hypothetical protein